MPPASNEEITMQALLNAESRIVTSIHAAADLIDGIGAGKVAEAMARLEASAAACKARLDAALSMLRSVTAGVLAEVEEAADYAEGITTPLATVEGVVTPAGGSLAAAPGVEAKPAAAEAPVRVEAPPVAEDDVLDLGMPTAYPSVPAYAEEGPPPAKVESPDGKRRGRKRGHHTLNGH